MIFTALLACPMSSLDSCQQLERGPFARGILFEHTPYHGPESAMVSLADGEQTEFQILGTSGFWRGYEILDVIKEGELDAITHLYFQKDRMAIVANDTLWVLLGFPQ